jgi:hypothetical protein
VNLGVHILPTPLTHERLQLGTLTRAVYQTLESVDGGLNAAGCFVMCHFEVSTNKLHVTMLPVGDPEMRDKLDTEIKEVGINVLLSQLSGLATNPTVAPNSVRVMYNTPDAMDTLSGVTIVHELGASRSEMQTVLSGLLSLIRT